MLINIRHRNTEPPVREQHGQMVRMVEKEKEQTCLSGKESSDSPEQNKSPASQKRELGGRRMSRI